jgi:hypothetical protein
MMRYLPDHGLPLVQLKEQRRDLVVALQNRNGPVSGWELMQIAAVQQAISAFEDVISDLDGTGSGGLRRSSFSGVDGRDRSDQLSRGRAPTLTQPRRPKTSCDTL